MNQNLTTGKPMECCGKITALKIKNLKADSLKI